MLLKILLLTGSPGLLGHPTGGRLAACWQSLQCRSPGRACNPPAYYSRSRCGPGHVARYLREHGAQVYGIDLSLELVERARRLNPGIEFHQGTMFALEAADATWAGITAFYSIIHVPRTDHVLVLSEMRRVLRPGGLLLLVFHVGDGVVHFDELWQQSVSIDFHFFRTEEVVDSLRSMFDLPLVSPLVVGLI